MSRNSLSRYLSRLKQNNNKIYDYIYNPVEPQFFENSQAKKTGRDIIGRVSRDDPQKWGKESITLLPELIPERPQIKYRIIGATEKIKATFQQLGLSRYIDYIDQINDDRELLRFYDSLDIFVHSSQIGETFGSVIAEAMARSLPVVTVRRGNMADDNAQEELVEDYKTGFVTNNQTELKSAVLKLLRNPELASEMGKKGFQKAKTEFNVSLLVRKLENIYRQVLS